MGKYSDTNIIRAKDYNSRNGTLITECKWCKELVRVNKYFEQKNWLLSYLTVKERENFPMTLCGVCYDIAVDVMPDNYWRRFICGDLLNDSYGNTNKVTAIVPMTTTTTKSTYVSKEEIALSRLKRLVCEYKEDGNAENRG